MDSYLTRIQSMTLAQKLMEMMERGGWITCPVDSRSILLELIQEVIDENPPE